MSPATLFKLGDIAEFIRGVTYKPSDVTTEFDTNGIPCLRTKNIQSILEIEDLVFIKKDLVKNSKIVNEGDILVSSANSWNLVGKCVWIPRLDNDFSFGGFTSILRATSENVEPRYLYRWFSSRYIQELARSFGQQTTNISNLNHNRCLELQIPLPPLSEQKRIAAILDKADALRQKRKKAIALLDSLTQSIFLDMFGDIIQNERRFPSGAISDWVADFDTGKNLAPDSDSAAAGGFRVLKVSAVTSGEFRAIESKPLPLGYTPPESHLIHRSDVLFSRANTAELIGATAIVRHEVDRLALPDKIWRFVFQKTNCPNSTFLHSLFSSPSMRNELSKRATGTSGSMKNISKNKVLSIKVGLPKLELQSEFAEKADHIHDQLSAAKRQFEMIDQCFTSLQHRAFSAQF